MYYTKHSKTNYNNYTFVICGNIDIDVLKYNEATKVNNYVNDITNMGCIIPIDRSTRIMETSDTNFTILAKNIDELHTLAQNELQKINK